MILPWCKCGNAGPKDRDPESCRDCWIQKWYPEAVPSFHEFSTCIAKPSTIRSSEPCIHRSSEPVRSEKCKTCKGHVELKIFGCAKHGECVLSRRNGLRNCGDCPDHEAEPQGEFKKSSSSVRALMALKGPKSELPKDFYDWPNTAEAFRTLIYDWARNPEKTPDFTIARGITICGGGWRFFPSVYVTVRVIRHHGCTLPIQVWHLDGEYDPRMGEATDPYDVEWVNGSEKARAIGKRTMGGWEMKAFAAAYSPFREVLALDADSYPIYNPETFLELPGYREKGAFFSPDWGVLRKSQWERFGLQNRKEATESGQLAFDKSRHWECAWLSSKLCDYSDYVFRHIYGDKDTFTLGWRIMGHDFATCPHKPKMHRVAGIQGGPDGKPAFVHRISDKFKWEGTIDQREIANKFMSPQSSKANIFVDSLPLEMECHQFNREGRDAIKDRHTWDAPCKDFDVIRFDETNLNTEVPGVRINSSIAKHGNDFIMAYRTGVDAGRSDWNGSDIWTTKLDREFRPYGAPTKINLAIPEGNLGREDCRIFWHKGQMHLSYIGVQGNGRHIDRTNQCFCRLNDDIQVDGEWSTNITNRRGWEKNWSFFDHLGCLYAVYLTHPRHMIAKITCSKAEVAFDEPNHFPWSGGEIRGSAPPIRVGDEYWSFAHDRVGHSYRVILYAFSASPPFRPTRMIAEPILQADESTKVFGTSVIFPCGAVQVGEHIVLSCGIHDRWTELRRLSVADLDRRLG